VEAYDLQRLNVVIVDDNRHMRFLLKTILHTFGIREIAEAGDGADALKILKLFPADVVITDWMMEPIDGIEMTRFIRTDSDSQNPFVPIIMLTGHTEAKRVQEARDAGVTEFLAKPISSKMVYHRLVQLIEKPRTFVKARRFTGPDRRRKFLRVEGQDRRAVDRA
jgi:two-component system chemotaxis response regulator CheY